MRYYLIAGEASGDLHGSNLMKGLYAGDPDADMRFWGGPLMNEVYRAAQNGVNGLARDYKDGAVMGFSQVVLHAGEFLARLRQCEADILSFRPDVVILIDYPGFNFRIAEFAHKQGLKVFYYIAPKVWASREGRIKKLKAYVDRLFIVFPFEKPYFDSKGISYIYKGNPLVDAVDQAVIPAREDFLASCGLPSDAKYIALLAGSRKGEVSSMMDTLSVFSDRMRALPEYSSFHFIIAGAPSRSPSDYAPYLEGRQEWLHLVFGQTQAIVKHAEAAVVNSGTASLETCLLGTPQVVGYCQSPINFNLARLLIKVPYISLGNLILGKMAFKELMQYYFTPDNLLTEVRRLLEDVEYREEMLADYASIREALGGGGASLAVARAMLEELRRD